MPAVERMLSGMDAKPRRPDVWKSPWPAAGLIGLLVLAAFLPAVAFGFVNWDDDRYVYDNPLVLGGLSAAGVWRSFTETVFFNWAPLTVLSYQLDATLYGPNPRGFHLTSVVVHAVAAAVLFVALLRMTAAPWRSAAATLLFAIHPLRVESVAWVAERKDVLSVFFLMLALLAYERFCRRPGSGRYAAVFAAMLTSLLCKATLVTLPVLLVLLDAWPLGRISLPGVARPVRGDGGPSPYPARSRRDVLAEKLPLVLLSLLFVVVTLWTQRAAIQSEEAMPFWSARLPNAVGSSAWYVLRTFWPTGLHPVYRHAGIQDGTGWIVPGSAAVIVAMIVVAGRAGRRIPALPVGIAWFLVSLLPVLGLVAQQGFQSHADRFTYVPHVGLAMAIVWGGASCAARAGLSPKGIAAIVAAVAVALLALTELQLQTWRNSETLWNHALACDPGNPIAHYNLGLVLEAAGHQDEAVDHYRLSLRSDPAYLPARNNLATILIERGWIEEARPHVERALLGERDPRTFINLAMLLLAERRPAEAAEAAGQAIDADGRSAAAHFVRGRALAAQGLVAGAIGAYESALSLDRTHAQARNNLATSLARAGRLDEAIAHFRVIIAAAPDSPVALQNLATALAEAGRHDEAAAIRRRLEPLVPSPAPPPGDGQPGRDAPPPSGP